MDPVKNKSLQFFRKWFFGIVLVIGEFFPITASEFVHLVYSGNLSGYLDDCQCGGKIVGGLSRILTSIRQLRRQYPELILVDSGDYLSSYSLPENNQKMLQLLALANYDALNLGDQEFVESVEFIFKTKEALGLEIPFLSTNLRQSKTNEPVTQQIKIIERDNLKIALLGILDLESEIFDSLTSCNFKITSPKETLQKYHKEVETYSDLQVLLYHGNWEKGLKFLKLHPWIDVVIFSHNHRKHFAIQGYTALAENGVNGEYLGYLKLQKKGKHWIFKNNFIPIHIRIPINIQAQKLIDSY